MAPSDSTAPGHQHGFRWQHRLLILSLAPLYLQFHRFPQHMNHPASFSPVSPSCTLSFPTLHYIFVHLNITCCSDPRGLGPELVCYVPGCPHQPQIRNLNRTYLFLKNTVIVTLVTISAVLLLFLFYWQIILCS